MTIDEFAAKLTGATKRGRGYTAACPPHPEDGAILKIRSEFGQIEIDCRKGCPDHEVVRALGLSMIDLMCDDDDDDLPAMDFSPEDEIYREEETPAEETIWPPPAPDTWGTERTNAFDAMPAREWLRTSRSRPMPRQLFGPFWMEGELSILFADTGKGKSVLAVQIAEALASGRGLAPFEPEIPARKVLYFDFELSEKMFEARYSVASEQVGGAGSDHYPFDENFIRAQLNGDPEFPDYYETWGEYLGHSTAELLKETGARLMMAVRQRVGDKPLIHHSDRGIQYASSVYQNELRKNNINPSMTDGYDCYQNALAERINGILKQEFLLETCNTGSELELLVKESVEIYNRKRPHLSLSMMTPELVHKKAHESSFTGLFYST